MEITWIRSKRLEDKKIHLGTELHVTYIFTCCFLRPSNSLDFDVKSSPGLMNVGDLWSCPDIPTKNYSRLALLLTNHNPAPVVRDTRPSSGMRVTVPEKVIILHWDTCLFQSLLTDISSFDLQHCCFMAIYFVSCNIFSTWLSFNIFYKSITILFHLMITDSMKKYCFACHRLSTNKSRKYHWNHWKTIWYKDIFIAYPWLPTAIGFPRWVPLGTSV